MSVKRINTTIRISCLTGILLSIYALHVETSKKQNSDYVALCDISEHMSCSNVFQSSYATGFGLAPKDSPLNQPNSLAGIMFYSVFFLCSYLDYAFVTKLLIGLAVLSNIGSVYFASILYFVLHDFCVVCVSSYVVNFVNLFAVFSKLKALGSKNSQKSKKKSK